MNRRGLLRSLAGGVAALCGAKVVKAAPAKVPAPTPTTRMPATVAVVCLTATGPHYTSMPVVTISR